MALTLPSAVSVNQIDTSTRYNADIDYLLRAGYRRLSSFPTPVDTGELFWHTGYTPNRLFMWTGSAWQLRAGDVSCCIYNNATIVGFFTASTSQVPMNAFRWRTGSSMWSGGNYITVPYDGMYLVSGSLEFAPNATGQRGAFLQTSSGTAFIAAYFTQAVGGGLNTNIPPLSRIYRLAAGANVNLAAYQNSGGGLNINSVNPYSPEIMVQWIAP